MDKTIYFILSKQSRMQTGLYFQLVVVTKCKQYFHVSSTLSTLVLYYSISHCSPKKTHFISKSLVFQFDSHLLPFAAYFVFFSICHWNKIRRRRCQLCIHVARISRAPVAFPVYLSLYLFRTWTNENTSKRTHYQTRALNPQLVVKPPPPPYANALHCVYYCGCTWLVYWFKNVDSCSFDILEYLNLGFQQPRPSTLNSSMTFLNDWNPNDFSCCSCYFIQIIFCATLPTATTTARSSSRNLGQQQVLFVQCS